MTCNYTALTEFLLSENPIIDSDSNHPLRLSAIHGNESVVRWFLGSTSANATNVTEALSIATENRHENLVAILVDAGADFNDTPDHSWKMFIHQVLRSGLSELVVHTILAVAHATKSESECHLQQAADRGHEGAIVLLSYKKTMKRLDTCGYSNRLMHNSGSFQRVIAALANFLDIMPAFGLTLLSAERRRTEVRLHTWMLPQGAEVIIYLDSYHAYIASVRRGLQHFYRKAIKIRMSSEYSFIVVHQEKSLELTCVPPKSRSRFYDELVPSAIVIKVGSHIETIRFKYTDECHVELPIS